MKIALSQLRNSSIFILILFILVGCSKDDDTTEQSNFEPITLDFGNLGVEDDDTSFTIQGYTFKSYYAVSEEDTYATFNGETERKPYDGVALYQTGPDGTWANIEMELAQFTGASKITVTLYSNTSNATTIELIKNGTMASEITVDSQVTETQIDLTSNKYDILKVISVEGMVIKMVIE